MSSRIQAMQVAVFVMCGGGFLGQFAAAQPADFYAEIEGLDPHSLEVGEALDDLPNMRGVF